ncbi:MAG: lactonase family protein [Deltaproteobacteria bacterium]
MSTLLAASVSAGAASAEEAAVRVYIGTYTGEHSRGIYLSQLDLATGALSPAELAGEVKNPSFLAIHPNRKFVYAVSEVSDAGGKPTGAVSAFAVEPKSGKLKLLNQQSSQGAGPCHLVVDASGKCVLVANYGSGSCAALPIGNDGKLGEATAAIQHVGKSVNPGRQEGPHAHSINLDPANRFAFVADLGLDKVLIYRFDPAKGSLAANDPPSAAVAPGSGPRHFTFHPSGKFAYVINEIANTVTAFAYDAARGSLRDIQTITTLPEGYKETSYTAEVVAHPSGKFLYGSNRGHDSIAIFTIDAATGKLTAAGHQSTGGKTPRNFAINPTGKWLLAENQGSGTIVVLQIDPKTGGLKPTGHTLEVASPVCVRMVRLGD